jgi:hypothetical protein
MGLKSPSDGCWDLIKSRDRMMIDQAFAHEREEDVFIQDFPRQSEYRGGLHSFP